MIMAGASAGGMAKKSAKRLRTIGKTKKGRYATKSERAKDKAINAKMAKSFERAIKRGSKKANQGKLF